jgi:glucose-1-phosphate adenylyltransferase
MRLDPLTRQRSKPAVPLAGKYRLIDVPISNAIHSGMHRMFILTQFNSVSLHRHINATYHFSPFSKGFVEVLAAQQTPSDERWFQGTADAVRQHFDLLEEQRGGRVLVLSGDHIYRMDYSLLLREHASSGADVTLAVLPCNEEQIAGFGAVRTDESGRIVAFREKPRTPEERAGMLSPRQAETDPERPYLASMGIYLFEIDVLRAALAEGGVDFGRHIFPAAVAGSRVHAHRFDGYWRDIGTIGTFYDAHMDLVKMHPPFSFHDPEWPIYTHPRYLPGTRIDRVTLERCVLADGAVVTGSTLKETIVGVRCTIRDATVTRTLVMGADPDPPDAPATAPPIGIGPGSVVANAIVDKNARIGRNVRLVNENRVEEASGDGWIIRDGVIVVPKNAVVPDGTIV